MIVGAALAVARGAAVDPLSAALALAAAILMQLVSNLLNDVGYAVRGPVRSGSRSR